MRFVRQIYAGWLGVANKTHCTSGPVVFTLDNARRAQLLTVQPTRAEIKECLNSYNKHHGHDTHGFKKFMEDWIDDENA